MPPRWSFAGTVAINELIRLAGDLKSEDGSNSEYDRALVELIVDAAGLPMDSDGADEIKARVLGRKP